MTDEDEWSEWSEGKKQWSVEASLKMAGWLWGGRQGQTTRRSAKLRSSEGYQPAFTVHRNASRTIIDFSLCNALLTIKKSVFSHLHLAISLSRSP